MAPFFEENPWLLIPLIIVVVEAWNGLKALVRERREKTTETTEGDRP
jgi:hypothetical protein